MVEIAEQEDKKSGDSVRAVQRALGILLAFKAQDGGLTVAELLARVDLSRPTLYRLLGTLEQSGFIASSGEPQRFRLGSAVAHLAHVWTASQSLAQLAEPMLRKLWEASGETVALCVPDGSYRVCVAELESAQPLNFKRGVGSRGKLALGASGRAILAHMTLPDAKLTRYADETVDMDELRADLRVIRAQGYAVSREALIRGAIAIAAPFFNGVNQVAGSLVIYGPSARVTNRQQVARLAELAQGEAGELSRMLGRREGSSGKA
jgi:DNA-binding IclR family transcriptional regulator